MTDYLACLDPSKVEQIIREASAEMFLMSTDGILTSKSLTLNLLSQIQRLSSVHLSSLF